MNTLTWLVWLLAMLVVLGLANNPLYLVLALLAATLVFLACHQATPLARAYRLFFVIGLALWIGYIIFSVITIGGARGQTVVWTLPSLTLPPFLGGVTLGGPVTAEDAAWGAIRGLRIWTLLVVFGTFNALVNHYRLLRLTPRSLFHAGLVVAIALSFVPQTLRAITEIIESQRIRGHRFKGVRSYLALVAPLLATSLEKSIQLAESLDARGYGRTASGAAAAPSRQAGVEWLASFQRLRQPAKHDPHSIQQDYGALARQQMIALVGLLLLGAGVFGWLYYGASAGPVALALLVLGVAMLGIALWSLGRLVSRTTYRRERWRMRDTTICIAACVAAAGWIALRLYGAGALIYTPYPLLVAPEFHLGSGLLLILLAVPALFGAPRHEGRLVRRKHARRHIQPTPSTVADAPRQTQTSG